MLAARIGSNRKSPRVAAADAAASPSKFGSAVFKLVESELSQFSLRRSTGVTGIMILGSLENGCTVRRCGGFKSTGPRQCFNNRKLKKKPVQLTAREFELESRPVAPCAKS